MKKLIVILVGLCLLFTTACGNSDAAFTDPDSQTESTIETSTTEPEATPEPHEHEYTETVVEATCKEGGYTEFKCECGDTYKENETKSLEHEFGEWTEAKPATENEEGEMQRVCTVCETVETDVIPKLPEATHAHDYEEEIVKEATCTKTGESKMTCEECGHSYTNTVPKKSHDYQKVDTVAPTCNSKGYTNYKCSVCGTTYKDNYKSELSHNYSAWETTKEATESADGSAKRTCSVCGKTETRKIDKLPPAHTHSYSGKVTTAATCTKEGVKTYTCSCGSSYTESIPKTAHNYKSTTVAPTCTTDGYTGHKCSCGDSYTDSVTKAIGHSYSDNVVAPTCTEGGYTTHTCSGCSKSYTDTNVVALGHAYSFTSNTATCTVAGKQTETCSRCGNEKTTNTAATGHLHTETVTNKATCYHEGSEILKCTDCGAEISKTTTPKTNHSWETTSVSKFTDWCAQTGNEINAFGLPASGEWVVTACYNCGTYEDGTVAFAYSQSEAAANMLGWVNELRAGICGENDLLTLDSGLCAIAQSRAQAIASDFSHNGATTAENIASNVTLYGAFSSWENSPGHWKNMVSACTKMGFGYYQMDTYLYFVMTFG